MKTADSLFVELQNLELDHQLNKIDYDTFYNKSVELLTTWKEDICKKQRDKVVFEQSGIMMSLKKNNPEWFDELKELWRDLSNVGLNAPKPT